MRKETKKEFGKFLIDIAKYIITAIVVSSFFKSLSNTWIIYVFGTLTAGVFISAGFWYIDQSNKEK